MKTEETQVELKPTKRRDVFVIDPRLLTIEEGLNFRRSYDGIDELADNIEKNGVLNPLTCFRKGNEYVVVNGHRRFYAIQKVLERGYDLYVPVIMEPKNISQEDRIIEMLTLNQAEDFSILEKAEGVRRLVQVCGLSIAQAAIKLGWSRSQVNNLELVSRFPEKIKALIDKKICPYTKIIELYKKENNYNKVYEIIMDSYTQAMNDEEGEEESSGRKSSTRKKVISNLTKKGFSKNSLAVFRKLIKLQEKHNIPVKEDAKEVYQFIIDMFTKSITLDELAGQFLVEPIPDKKKYGKQLRVDEEDEKAETEESED